MKKRRDVLTDAVLLVLIGVSSFYLTTMLLVRSGDRLPSPAVTPVALPLPISKKVDPAEVWLKNHYPALLTRTEAVTLYKTLIEGYSVPQTGLFLSFPRTGDIRLIQQASTYDQGIIGILLLKMGDYDRAGRIISFYEKAWASAAERSGPRQGIYGLANFYNAYFSVEGIEKTMHVGPNAWIGLLASRYARVTGDKRALELALNIARWMIEKVPHTDGAIAMGQILWNSAPWDKIYSTENNLSAHAFLGDLLKCSGVKASDRRLISREHRRIGNWLTQKAYQPGTQTILRGFHPHGLDTAGAIDSYTWFINALRPARLNALGIPPHALMRRAGTDFAVQVDGQIGVDAVDAAMAKATYADALITPYKGISFLRPSVNGHRLIWYEGTGQYAVALQDMARYEVHRAFKFPDGSERVSRLNEASAWLEQARLYTHAMDQAKTTTSQGTYYPCATTGRFYLHGWPAPEPFEGRLSDASAALVWRLFAGMGYEPLTDTQIAPAHKWRMERFAWRTVRNPGTSLLYGASEEMMVWAWTLYEKGETDAAWRQARSTIQLWEEDAKELQKKKMEKVGTYLPFDGTIEGYQRIHDYWALNDVASSYFILARIAHEEGRYAEASLCLSKILREFSLAQMWDKRGWFWNPIDTIRHEYVEARPDHYGGLREEIPVLPPLTVVAQSFP